MTNILVQTLTIGQLQTNCYLLTDQASRETIIIDPGDDPEYIIQKISDLKAIPTKILATHGHFDHILAAFCLQKTYSIPFLVNSEDTFLVKKMEKSCHYFLGIKSDPPPVINKNLSISANLLLGKNIINVIMSPGHTPGSVCFYLKNKKIIFTGDTLFANGSIGRTDFSYSSSADLIDSLKSIFDFPYNTCIFPGHGEKSDLKTEEKYFRFNLS